MRPNDAAMLAGIHNQIRAHIKSHLAESGETQAEFAAACRVSRPSLNKFLAGKVLGPAAIDRIGEYLELVVVKRRRGGKR